MSNECEHEWIYTDTQWQTTDYIPDSTATVQKFDEFAYYYCKKCLKTVKKIVEVKL